jgi:hypothetical protein
MSLIPLVSPNSIRLICSSDRRVNVEQIKNHSFFYGVDWEAIRQIDSPFVPRLRSITDTSYFPTDELQEVPDEPTGADTSGSNKDLAFLGFVLTFMVARACLSDITGTLSSGLTTIQALFECSGYIDHGLGVWVDCFLSLRLIVSLHFNGRYLNKDAAKLRPVRCAQFSKRGTSDCDLKPCA